VADSAQVPALWHSRDLRLLVGGRAASQLGDQLQSLALPLVVIAVTGSTLQAGIVLGLQTVASLVLGLVAGALVDRWDRRRTMVRCELGRAVLVASIPIAIAAHALALPQLCAVAVLNGALGTLFSAANSSAVPSLVPPAGLPRALGALSTIRNALRIVGAPLAGIAYGLGAVVPFTVNAVSFLASAVTLRAIRTPFQEQRRAPAPGPRALLQEIGEGLAWLAQRPAIRALAVLDALDSLRFGAGYLLIIVLARRLGAGPLEIGLVFTGAGVGGLLGSTLAARLAQRFPLGRLAIAMLWVEAATFPCYALAPTWWLLSAVAFAESVVAPVYSVALDTYRLTITPDAMRGRVTAAIDTVTTGGASIGTISSGALIGLLGPTALTFALAGLLVVLALTASGNRDIRGTRAVA
jgi:MFS family permease